MYARYMELATAPPTAGKKQAMTCAAAQILIDAVVMFPSICVMKIQ